ncbi:MAG: AAA+ family ATPase, partial [Desulfobacula sp.]|nr:AAA+ family ATPase [Desulfobacula sp.]
PVEVKAGTTGSLKSLHVFAQLKKTAVALRFNLDYPSIHKVKARVMNGVSHRFQLISLPLYMVLEAKRICRSITG